MKIGLAKLSVFALVLAGCVACGPGRAATPTETFKTYIKASQKKDAASMKVLLSDATLKMLEQEAQVQNAKIDDVITRETFIGEGQRAVEYRNEKIEGEKATLEYKTSYGMWNTMAFVLENGEWKIDKQSVMDQMLQDMDESNRKIDEAIRGILPASPL